VTQTTLELFSESCGATGPLAFEIRDGEEGAWVRRVFDQPFLIIGRNSDADLSLDQADVSRRHCFLQLIEGRLFCIDLGSRSGFHIGASLRQTSRSGWLDRQRPLRIGPVVLWLREGDAAGERDGGSDDEVPPDPQSAQYTRENPLPPTTLEISDARGATHQWQMDRAFALVGRAPTCRVRLLASGVSTFHGALVRTPGEIWLVDLLSSEGTYVAGNRVRLARLEEGVECHLGSFTLRHLGTALDGTQSPRAGRSRSQLARRKPSEAIAAGEGMPSLWTPDGSVADGPDTVNQAVMTLAQMLGAMHHDHMALVRDELAEIRRLAEEMHALRAELGGSRAEAPREAAAKSALAGPAVPPSPSPVPQPFLAGEVEPADPLQRRDPRVCLEIASEFLSKYERGQQGYWARVLRLVSNFSRGKTLSPDPAGTAPFA
jgi:pSer/pThr/pTyr-binding forkhead associated (FHA) protein